MACITLTCHDLTSKCRREVLKGLDDHMGAPSRKVIGALPGLRVYLRRPALRVSMPSAPVTRQPLLEALLVDRDRLIRVLRIALAELNARRLTTPSMTGEPDIGEALRYWDEVFGWVKQQGGADVVLMSRRT